MSKKPSKSLIPELKPFVAPFRFDGSRDFHLKSLKTDEKGGLDKDKAEKILDANRKRFKRSSGKTLRPGPLVGADDLSGHGRSRQGQRDQADIRGRQPARLRGSFVQGAIDERARARFFVAPRDRAAATRRHRHLQSLLL